MKITKPKGVWKKRMLISLMIVLGLALAGISYWNLSPVPKAFLIKKAFEGGTFVPSADYDHALNETKIVKDINYNSKFPDGKLNHLSEKSCRKNSYYFLGTWRWICRGR